MAKQRFDNLKAGTFVELDFNDKYTERGVFLRIDGEGDDRRAVFSIDTF